MLTPWMSQSSPEKGINLKSRAWSINISAEKMLIYCGMAPLPFPFSGKFLKACMSIMIQYEMENIQS